MMAETSQELVQQWRMSGWRLEQRLYKKPLNMLDGRAMLLNLWHKNEKGAVMAMVPDPAHQVGLAVTRTSVQDKNFSPRFDRPAAGGALDDFQKGFRYEFIERRHVEGRGVA